MGSPPVTADEERTLVLARIAKDLREQADAMLLDVGSLNVRSIRSAHRKAARYLRDYADGLEAET